MMIKYILFFLKEIKVFFTSISYQLNSLKNTNNKEFKKFLHNNKNVFKKYFNENNFTNNEVILTTAYAVGHPGYQITQMILGKYLEKILKIKAIGSMENKHFFINKLFKGYGYEEVHIFKRHNIFKRLKLFYISKKILIKLKTFNNFLNYEKDGVKIGKIVYEHYVRFTGEPSLDKFNFKINYFLFQALEFHQYSKELFKKKNIKYVVLSEKQFLPSGIIFQNALIHKAKIIARISGPRNIGLRIYNNQNEFYKSRYHFSKNLLKYTHKNHLNEVILKSKNILNERFSNSKVKKFDDTKGSELAFKNKKKFTKKSLCKKFRWDEKKPIVVIFDQHYLDGMYDSGRWYFKDHLDWIRSTFREIKNIKKVNWLIKSHPLDPHEIHHSTTGTDIEFKNIIGNTKHIKIFPKNFSAGIIPNIASVMTTAHGTPGIEYPCFGIPCILSNASHYSGNGFTIEPKTKKEYFKYLRNAYKLKKLPENTIRKAKTFLYLEIVGGRYEMPLLPKYEIGQKFFKKKRSNNFWIQCNSLILNYNIKYDKFYNIFKTQIYKKSKHLVNKKLIKYYEK